MRSSIVLSIFVATSLIASNHVLALPQPQAEEVSDLELFDHPPESGYVGGDQANRNSLPASRPSTARSTGRSGATVTTARTTAARSATSGNSRRTSAPVLQLPCPTSVSPGRQGRTTAVGGRSGTSTRAATATSLPGRGSATGVVEGGSRLTTLSAPAATKTAPSSTPTSRSEGSSSNDSIEQQSGEEAGKQKAAEEEKRKAEAAAQQESSAMSVGNTSRFTLVAAVVGAGLVVFA